MGGKEQRVRLAVAGHRRCIVQVVEILLKLKFLLVVYVGQQTPATLLLMLLNLFGAFGEEIQIYRHHACTFLAPVYKADLVGVCRLFVGVLVKLIEFVSDPVVQNIESQV